QRDGPSPRLNRVALRVHDDVAVGDRGRRGVRPRGPSKKGANACNELVRAERLRDVIIRTDLETGYSFGLLASRGEHDDWNQRGGGVRPGAMADFGAAHLRQHQVQDQQIRWSVRERRHAVTAVNGDFNGKSSSFEVSPYQIRDIAVVLDDQNSL